mmetsp:Transcript_49446/g.96700  ORF Transcript_49446/g.96700 Transcript_49446/m.96700 type:complete len:419 (+) Transcript_49446:5186-6442(+)
MIKKGMYDLGRGHMCCRFDCAVVTFRGDVGGPMYFQIFGGGDAPNTQTEQFWVVQDGDSPVTGGRGVGGDGAQATHRPSDGTVEVNVEGQAIPCKGAVSDTNEARSRPGRERALELVELALGHLHVSICVDSYTGAHVKCTFLKGLRRRSHRVGGRKAHRGILISHNLLPVEPHLHFLDKARDEVTQRRPRALWVPNGPTFCQCFRHPTHIQRPTERLNPSLVLILHMTTTRLALLLVHSLREPQETSPGIRESDRLAVQEQGQRGPGSFQDIFQVPQHVGQALVPGAPRVEKLVTSAHRQHGRTGVLSLLPRETRGVIIRSSDVLHEPLYVLGKSLNVRVYTTDDQVGEGQYGGPSRHFTGGDQVFQSRVRMVVIEEGRRQSRVAQRPHEATRGENLDGKAEGRVPVRSHSSTKERG